MKVLQINTLGSTFSTGRTTREMHNYFLKKGIESYIACPAPLDCNDAFFFSSRNSMRIDTVLTMLTGLEAHHSRIQTRRLLNYISSIKPDIVHLRVLHSNCINLNMLLKYLAKNDIVTVITLHDYWFLTGRCCYFTNLNCNKWVEGCSGCKMPNSKSRPWLFNRTKRMWEDKRKNLNAIRRIAFVGVSDWVVSEAIKSPMCTNAIVKRIYNWINLDTFCHQNAKAKRNEYSLQNKFVILGVAASWTPNDRKGLDNYIDLAYVIPENYTIVLVGKMGIDSTLPANILSVGQISDTNELASIYSMADVYLNLSTEETFGKVTAESLASGTPVVAINATANKELVPKDCGIVIDSLDTSVIIKALQKIELNGKDHYSENCIQFAKRNFDMETNIEEYLKLYEELQNHAD